MLISAFFGLGLEKYLPKRFQVGLGAVIGAGLGNALSDFMGGAVSLNWPLATGTGLGCLIALLAIPIFHKIQKKISQ
jgi:xanthine/uracil/vitamin C permease (AzgA family)